MADSDPPGDSAAPAEQPAPTGGPDMFAATAIDARKRRREAIAKWTTFGMSMALVVPVLAILFHIFHEAWPVLSWMPGVQRLRAHHCRYGSAL